MSAQASCFFRNETNPGPLVSRLRIAASSHVVGRFLPTGESCARRSWFARTGTWEGRLASCLVAVSGGKAGPHSFNFNSAACCGVRSCRHHRLLSPHAAPRQPLIGCVYHRASRIPAADVFQHLENVNKGSAAPCAYCTTWDAHAIVPLE